VFAGVPGYAGYRLSNGIKPAQDGVAAIESALRDDRAPDLDWQAAAGGAADLGGGRLQLVHLVDKAQGEQLTKRIKGVRQSLSEQMGLLLPPIGVRDDLTLRPNQYALAMSAAWWPKGR
jgi:flagellar biosynthesis protein FlhA